jgi:multimeric flavodoxin WrbA
LGRVVKGSGRSIRYFFSVSGQMKVFVDRTYALGGSGDWGAFSGKGVGLVFTYGDPDPLHSGVTNAYRMFQDACGFLGMDLMGCVHAACGEAGEVRSQPKVLGAAEELGRKLASA